MEKRCFHPKNYKISWIAEVEMDFCLKDGKLQPPLTRTCKPKPHVRFECEDCGFTAYYAPHRFPHWFPEKLKTAGTFFPQEENDRLKTVVHGGQVTSA